MKLIGMIKYEFKMHWRRRGLLVLTLALLAMATVMNIMLVTEDNTAQVLEDVVAKSTMSQASLETFFLIFGLWGLVSTMLIFILPIVTADTIPMDRQYGVYELIQSTSLTKAEYLGGKLIGMWLATFSSLVGVMVSQGVLWYVMKGNLWLPSYLGMWVFGAGSLVILNGSLGVLCPAMQPNRRRALIMMVILIFPISILSVGARSDSLVSYLGLARMNILNFYFSPDFTEPGFFSLVGDRHVQWSLLFGMVELLAAWGLVWGWMRYKEA